MPVSFTIFLVMTEFLELYLEELIELTLKGVTSFISLIEFKDNLGIFSHNVAFFLVISEMHIEFVFLAFFFWKLFIFLFLYKINELVGNDHRKHVIKT